MNQPKEYQVLIGVGSNIQPDKYIERMLPLLAQQIKIQKVATWLKTEPVGLKEQPDYTNGAVLGTTTHSKEELKQQLIQIEDLCDRDRNQIKYGPRSMDLDILIWEGSIVDDDVYERDFVQESVLELIPNFEIKRD